MVSICENLGFVSYNIAGDIRLNGNICKIRVFFEWQVMGAVGYPLAKNIFFNSNLQKNKL